MLSDPVFHAMSAEEALAVLGSSGEGLGEAEAAERLERFGKNQLEEEETNRLKVLLRQFNNPLAYVLFAASGIAALIGHVKDIVIILIVIFVNGFMAFYQEMKAETSIRALRKLTETKVRVRRGGKERDISSSEIVPGDIVLMREGSLVTADARILSAEGMAVDESPITGESVPVDKRGLMCCPPDAPPYDLHNMVLAGTIVVRGSAESVVVRTGKETYLASIVEKAKEKSPDSPLTKALGSFSKRYVAILLLVFVVMGVIGLLQGRPAWEIAYAMVAQLVSLIPEELPIVITIVLVVGVLALSRQKVLVRHLPAAETLGSATVIASDKTGTITEGKLNVQRTHGANLDSMKLVAALCNDSDGVSGDPIDSALVRWVGEETPAIRKRHPRLGIQPFDTHLRYMATCNDVSGKSQLMVKGAYEALLQMTPDREDAEMDAEVENMASKGLRVIALGIGEGKIGDPKVQVRIVGLVGFMDPPKEGVRDAVAAAKKAGIRIIMITGDHPSTARAVAAEVGICSEGDCTLNGLDMESMSDAELGSALENTTVLARILPEQKYRVVKVLQARGEIVAVTGDGVNDVPAIKVANLGIAMGRGTEAAKGVAKMVILDNDLGVIVGAIRMGRVIAMNIRKVIYYLVSTSMGEITLVSLAIVAGLPLPLRPTQILWINLVTDGVQDKTFPFAKEEGDVMAEKPRDPDFFGKAQIARTVFFGSIMGILALAMFIGLRENMGLALAMTIVFTTVAAVQWANGIQAQKEREPFFMNLRRSLTINPYIYLGALGGLALQIVAVYALSDWLYTVPLSLEHWLLVGLAFAIMFCVVEVRKWCEILLRRG